jgi:hypothetical protein
MEYWIKFDIGKIEELKANQEEFMQITLDMLPAGVNWKKEKEVIDYFNNVLDIELNTIQIQEIEGHLELQEENTDAWEIVYGLTAYLKMKYTVINYLNCILKHQICGVVNLRFSNGEILFPNKRPMSHSEEIKSCITHTNVPGE